MKVKEVAFVVRYFPSISETFIVNQINGLIDSGIRVHLYAYKNTEIAFVHKSIERHNLIENVNYFVEPPKNKLLRLWVFIKWVFRHLFKIEWSLFLKSVNIFKRGKEAYSLKLFFEARWFLIPYNFDLIHAHFGMNGNRIAYLKSCGILPEHIRIITTFHGYDLIPNRLEDYKKEYSYLFKVATAFTVNTPYLEGILKQVNNFNKPIYILPVGLDTSFFKRQFPPKESEYFDVVFCGRFINFKAPDVAIEILFELHKLGYDKVRLFMIGGGKLNSMLENLVESYKIQDNVIFCGTLSQREIKKKFEKADAFLLPGRYDLETGRAETQGLVIQEAQAMELPVVISDVGGMKYGVKINKSGFVVPEGDVEGFVNALEKLILNPKLKYEIGKSGRLLVEAKYDNNVLIKRLLKIYDKYTL